MIRRLQTSLWPPYCFYLGNALKEVQFPILQVPAFSSRSHFLDRLVYLTIFSFEILVYPQLIYESKAGPVLIVPVQRFI